MHAPELELHLRRRRLTRSLVGLVLVIIALHLFWWSTDSLDLPGETLWRRLANVDAENAFPTWLAAVLMTGAAGLSAVLGRDEHRREGSYARHWYVLAAIMAVLSVDEVAALHEATAGPLRAALDLSGLFYYGWVVPALIGVVVLTVAYGRFVLALRAPAKGRVVLAAALFVGGAVGLEMVAGLFAGTAARDGAGFFLLATTEEVMELAGLILLIDTFLLLLEDRRPRILVTLGR
ncbi:MAG TPA: hypothetical protein VHL52_07885 [Acidimicrobiia bacterium]|nr:hypothetical protein [Acidimicrobiia bacterium]